MRMWENLSNSLKWKLGEARYRVHVCNPSTGEPEEELLQIWGHPRLLSEYQANQRYVAGPYLKKKEKEKKSTYYKFCELIL